MARVYVGGPKGSGKTTACKLVAEKLGISCLTGSEIMREAAGISTREELERLPEDVKEDLRLHAFEFYYKSTPDLVIDGHFYLTETDMQYFDAYILVEVDTERLTNFRKNDNSRERPQKHSSIIEEMAELEDKVKKLEKNFGIKVIRIRNDETLDELAKSIEGVYFSVYSDEVRRELRWQGKERI